MSINISSQLGLQHTARLGSFFSYLVAFILVLGSIRGMIVLNSDLTAITVYNTTAFLLFILSAYGCLTSGELKNADIVLLRKLLLTNVLLGIVNVVIDLLFDIPFEPSAFYIYLLPYVVFLFLRIPTSYLNGSFTIIAIAISYSVIDNFFETLSGLSGYQNVFDYNAKLRPDIFEGLSRTGEFYRAAGYTGNCHDSANILGMLGSFFFIRYMVSGKWLDLGLGLFALLSLTLTQSASNIIVAISTCVIFSVYVLAICWKPRTFVSLLVVVVAISCLVLIFGDVITIFTQRVDADSIEYEMMTQLDMDSLVSAIPFFIIGHAQAFGSEIIKTEISHLKTLFQLGIIHALILIVIILYPILRFMKIRSFCFEALPGAAAIFFGFMSLFHYGSLFRSTSILLFYAIYTTCLINIINCDNSMRLSGRESSEEGLGISPTP